MTSGTTGTPGAPPSGSTGFWTYHNWSGTDGKYENTGGRIRSKWNSYVAQKARLQISNAQVLWHCPLSGGHNTVSNFLVNFYNNDSVGSSLGSFSASEKNAILAKLLSKVKGHSFNAAVNLSQAGQLASMVSSNLGKLGRSIMALKHGDFATAARQLGAAPKVSRLRSTDISGRWLELQYGWLPTISDTFEAAKAFEAISNGPMTARFSTGRHKTGGQTVSTGIGSIEAHLSQERVINYTFEAEEELSFSRQLGLTDPLSILWEHIPYSFVVDWFIPIGTYLSNLNQIPHLKGRWMVTESIVTRGFTVHKLPGPLPFCGTHGFQQCDSFSINVKGNYSRINTARDALASPPKVSFPGVKLGGAVHDRRVWNAISLASQRFLR